MFVFVPISEPTSAEKHASERYKKWIDDPKYLKVIDLEIGHYTLAIMADKRVELRTARIIGAAKRYEVVKTYTINDDDTIDGWVMISWRCDPAKNQEWNDELKNKVISTYRKEML
jgi:hypothetical protein